MKIALTHPFCWPYVRRGAERFLAELAAYLTENSHDVYTISSKKGTPRVEQGEGGTRILKRQHWVPALSRIRIHPMHAFAVDTFREIRKLRPQLVQSLYFMDALGSELARSPHHRHKTVYYVAGPPIPGYQPRIPPDRWFLRQAILKADAIAVPSAYVADLVRQYYDVPPTILPVPCDATHFTPDAGRRSRRPLVLGMAAFNEPRKGALQIAQAFARAKVRVPDARLRLCGEIDSRRQRDLLASIPAAAARDIEFPGVGDLGNLPNHYRESWVTVQPAKWESYGLVLLESWGCGTPVIAARHGALPELVTKPELGALFDPGGPESQVGIENVEGLAAAMVDALSAPVSERRAQVCRLKAEACSWEALGPRFLAFYDEVLKIPAGFREK